MRLRLMQRLFWVYTITIPILAVLPINGSNSRLNDTYLISIRLDYILHVGIYFLWMILYKLAYNSKIATFRKIESLWFVLLVVLFALLSEFVQSLIPYRSFNINDLVANLIGVFSGLLFLFIMPVKVSGMASGTHSKI
jgi:VanZ family protein